MKRNIFSVLLVCLMIVSVCVLSGCKVDDLEAQVNENASAAEGAVSDAISKAEADVDAAAKQAAADLAAAKEELTKLIADSANADAEALEAAVADFNAAVADVEAALAAAEEAAKDSDEATAAALADLEAELTTALEDAAEAISGTAAQELAAVKAELLAAIANGNENSAAEISSAVAGAVENLTALIATVQKTDMDYADALKAELDAKFEEAIDEVAAAASADLDAAVAALEAAIALKADAAAVEAANAELQAQVDALVDVLEVLTGDAYADLEALGNVKAYIAAEIAAAKAVSDAAYIVVENWTAASEEALKAVETLAVKYYGLNRDLYYAKELAALDVAYDKAVVALTREADAAKVAGVLADGVAALDAVATKAEVIKAALTAKGATADDVVRNDEWNEIITDAEAAIAAETDEAVAKSLEEVAALAAAFRARYEALAGNADDAEVLNDRVAALIADIEADGYTAAIKAAYEALKGDIAAWDEATGAANVALVDREAVADLDTNYAAAVAEYNNAEAEVLAAVDAFNGEYVYNYNADLKAINDAKAAYEKWAADVAARGFEAAAATANAYKAFVEGAYARAQALETADAEADAIEARIAALTKSLNELTVVRSAYQTELAAIKADAAEWVKAYFSGDYAAEAVEGNANYAILAHADIVALEALYAEVMTEIMDLANNLKAALEEIKTVDIYSGLEIEAASNAYTAFTNKLADLEYAIEGLDDTAAITATIAEQTAAYKALVAKVLAAYPAVDSAADVKLSSKDDVDALVKWYADNFKLDITKADADLAVEIVLDKDHVINSKAVADAKAAVDAYADLTDAKKVEFDTLKAEIEAILKETASTALADRVADAIDAYKAWLKGTNAPEGFKAEQFVPVNADALDAEKDALDDFYIEIIKLEAQALALVKRIEALVVDYKKLNTAALLAEAKDVLATLKADIEAFTKNNDGVDCFASYKTDLAAAQTAIDQAAALAELTAEKDALVAKVAALDVKANMTARAEAALKAGVAAIEANDAEGIKLAYANFELFNATIDAYVAALATAGADAAVVYEAYVLLDNRIDMVRASQLADELVIVEATFKAVL